MLGGLPRRRGARGPGSGRVAPDPRSGVRPIDIASVPSSRDYSDGLNVRPDVSAIVVVTRHHAAHAVYTIPTTGDRRRPAVSRCRRCPSAPLGILPTMRIAIATDHAGFPLKAPILEL